MTPTLDHTTVVHSDEVKALLDFSKHQVMVVKAEEKLTDETMEQSVVKGLEDPSQKWISPMYLYDEYGSQLYEEITELPEYYPTRTERLILEMVSGELCEVFPAERPTNPIQIVELGSGSSEKTRVLLTAYEKALSLEEKPLFYIPIDVSDTMLDLSAYQLAEEYPGLNILGIAGDYQDALRVLPLHSERLFLFIGGTLGNFTPAFQKEFFTSLFNKMTSGNHLLLGFDCAANETKPFRMIEKAYDDAEGITAKFNLNLLTHLNRKLKTDFVLENFRHQAIYNQDKNQIEMHLISLCDQVVSMPSAGKTFDFKKGETILTELSRKFNPPILQQSFVDLGYEHVKTWHDSDRYFGLMLLKKA